MDLSIEFDDHFENSKISNENSTFFLFDGNLEIRLLYKMNCLCVSPSIRRRLFTSRLFPEIIYTV